MEVAMLAGEIKECGLYALPDGRELVAERGGKYGFFKLYDPLAWEFKGTPLYETDARGFLTSLGRPTPWRVEDLKEVGRTEPRKH
jgi:hypothetical protein